MGAAEGMVPGQKNSGKELVLFLQFAQLSAIIFIYKI